MGSVLYTCTREVSFRPGQALKVSKPLRHCRAQEPREARLRRNLDVKDRDLEIEKGQAGLP